MSKPVGEPVPFTPGEWVYDIQTGDDYVVLWKCADATNHYRVRDAWAAWREPCPDEFPSGPETAAWCARVEAARDALAAALGARP